jgi:hypothetical protein
MAVRWRRQMLRSEHLVEDDFYGYGSSRSVAASPRTAMKASTALRGEAAVNN